MNNKRNKVHVATCVCVHRTPIPCISASCADFVNVCKHTLKSAEINMCNTVPTHITIIMVNRAYIGRVVLWSQTLTTRGQLHIWYGVHIWGGGWCAVGHVSGGVHVCMSIREKNGQITFINHQHTGSWHGSRHTASESWWMALAS